MNQRQQQILQALWALKEDAAYAWQLMLSGDERHLSEVGKSVKQLESVIISNDNPVNTPR
jgi:hypothetical protein